MTLPENGRKLGRRSKGATVRSEGEPSDKENKVKVATTIMTALLALSAFVFIYGLYNLGFTTPPEIIASDVTPKAGDT